MTPQLVICHLYPELMNIYGDTGNIIALSRRATWRHITVEIKTCLLGDTVKPGETDLYFFGGGQDAAQTAVAADLKRLKAVIATEIEDGVPALTVCGGFQLFGQQYVDQDGQSMDGLGIFNVETRAGSPRFVGNVLVETGPEFGRHQLIGFENHSGRTYLGDGAHPFATVLSGHGNNGSDQTEGVVHHHAIGTYMHGSLLPKNPWLTDWLIEQAMKRKQPNFTLAPLDDTLERAAFSEALSIL